MIDALSLRTLASLAVLLLPAAAIDAADWGASTEVQAYALGDENPGLQQSGASATVAGVTEFRLRGYRRQETSELSIDSKVRLQRYTGVSSAFDQDVGTLGASYLHKAERSSWGFNLAATRDSTLTTELATTGLNQLNLTHDGYRAGVSAVWRPAERISLAGGADVYYDRYAEGASHGLYDYRRQTAQVSANYLPTERLQFGLVAAASRFDSLGPLASSDTRNLSAQVRYAVGTRWSLGAAAGPSRSNSALGQDGGLEFSADLSRRTDRGNLALTLSRSVSTTGYGLLVQSQQLTFEASRQLLENLAATASLAAVQTQKLFPGLDVTFSDVRYGRAETQLQWRFASDWNLILGAAYARQHIQYADVDPQGFTARLGLSWHRTYHGG